MGERESQTETAASVRAALDSLGKCDASMLLHRVQVRGWLADAGINDRALLVAFGELASEGVLYAWWHGEGVPMEDATRTISALGMGSAVPRALLAQVLAPAHPEVHPVASGELRGPGPPVGPTVSGRSGISDEHLRALFDRFVAVQLLNHHPAVSWEDFALRVREEALRLKTLKGWPEVTFRIVVKHRKPRLQGRAAGVANGRTVAHQLEFSTDNNAVLHRDVVADTDLARSLPKVQVIEQVFARMSEAYLPHIGGRWTANLHFEILGIGEYSVEISGGVVNSAKGRVGSPSCVINFASADTFIDIVGGKQKATNAFMGGMIRTSNMGELRRFFACFDMTKAVSSKKVPATVAPVSPQTMVSAPAPAASSGTAGVVPAKPAGSSRPQSVQGQPDTGGGTGSAGPRVAYPALNKNGGPPAGSVTSPGRAQTGRTGGAQTGRTGGARIQTARAVVVLLVALCGGDWTAARAMSLQCPEGFVGIRAGSFESGSSVFEVDRPFCMQATEVTQGQYLSVMGQNPSLFQDCGADCPVEQVSWSDAAAYADALNQRAGLAACGTGETVLGHECRGYRLPTAAEWYYVAQASTLESSWESPHTVSWHDGNSDRQPHAVATKPANAWGVYDMLGNLREWYDGGVILSGAWSEPYRHAAGVSVWGGMRGVGASDIGFRVVRSLTTEGCLPYFHRIAGVCISDSRDCSDVASNASAASQRWLGNRWGACTATQCVPGFELNVGMCRAGRVLGAFCSSDLDCASEHCSSLAQESQGRRCGPAGMNWVPPGAYLMGSPATETKRDADELLHQVTMTRGFFLDRTEVTQEAWQSAMGSNPSQHTACGAGCPVDSVSWFDAVRFANARSVSEGLPPCYYEDGSFVGLACIGYRLPSEAEWEYAARAGTAAATYMGDLSGGNDDCSTAEVNLDGIAWSCLNSGWLTQAVGGKAANAFGLSDMLGNVWEWTGDWYGGYPDTVTDPIGPATGSSRVFRGGSWRTYARGVRAAYRGNNKPDFHSDNLGFRLARTAP